MSVDKRLVIEELLHLVLHRPDMASGLRWFQIEQLLLDATEPPFGQLEAAIGWALSVDDHALTSLVPPGTAAPEDLRSFLSTVRAQLRKHLADFEQSQLRWRAYQARIRDSHRVIAKLKDRCRPPWLDVTAKYFNEMVDDAGGLRGDALASWLQGEFLRRFRCVKDAPRWLELVPWPMATGTPLMFVGQLPLESSDDGSGYVYVFIDPTSDAVHTIVQHNRIMAGSIT